MRLLILLESPLRRSIARQIQTTSPKTPCVRRYATGKAIDGSKQNITGLSAKEAGTPIAGTRSNAAPSYAKTPVRRGPPEKILIYNGGTGRVVFLGALRITTIFVFGVSCLVVAPAFEADAFPWWTSPAIIVAGSIPMLYVAYTAAPFVNYIHLALPPFARRSRENAIQYVKNLPPTATLYINTMKFTTIPRQTQVHMADLVPDKALLRPVSFRNQNPAATPWWRGRTLRQFYTAEKSQPGKPSSTFYPELWEHVYKQIQSKKPVKA